jgi:uncharacterized membrane protein YfcA
MMIAAYIALGVVAGLLSSIMGIGGGIIIVPALVLIFGLTQHQAQGTTLALLAAPIGFLAAATYYKQGYVNVKMAVFICIGFLLGTLPGAKIATQMDTGLLQKLFGVVLFILSLKMIFLP